MYENLTVAQFIKGKSPKNLNTLAQTTNPRQPTFTQPSERTACHLNLLNKRGGIGLKLLQHYISFF